MPKTESEKIEAIVREHSAYLLYGAMSMGVPKNEAEDLVQETFLTYLKKPSNFQGRSALKSYLFGILYNKARERGRKRARELATDPVDRIFEERMSGPMGHWTSPPKGPDDLALADELSGMIEECMEGLSEDQRAAFHLREVERTAPDEICNVLDVTRTNLRVLLFRARIKLRNCLEAKGAKA